MLKKPLNIKTGPYIKVKSLHPKIIDDTNDAIYKQKHNTKKLKIKSKKIKKSLINDIKEETELQAMIKNKYQSKQEDLDRKLFNKYTDKIQQAKKDIEKERTSQINIKRNKKKSKRIAGNAANK